MEITWPVATFLIVFMVLLFILVINMENDDE